MKQSTIITKYRLNINILVDLLGFINTSGLMIHAVPPKNKHGRLGSIHDDYTKCVKSTGRKIYNGKHHVYSNMSIAYYDKTQMAQFSFKTHEGEMVVKDLPLDDFNKHLNNAVKLLIKDEPTNPIEYFLNL